MPNILRGKVLSILFTAAILVTTSSLFAQVGCGGFNGSPQPSGGVTSGLPGSLCLNDPAPVAETITINASNVADGSNPNNFAVVIDWDDGSPLQILRYGVATNPVPVQHLGNHSYRIENIPHNFLPKACNATMGRQCAYKPRIYLRIAGTTCPAEFGNPPDFFKFNTDDQCSGNMNLTETATNRNVYEVCAGSSANVTFTDRTVLNCLPPQELTGLNATRRWRRFVYGTFNNITEGGPTEQVMIGGVAQTFPFNASAAPTVSGNALTTSAPPFASNNTLAITIPPTAQVGEEFHIRMQYWNICNRYDDGVGAPPANGDRPPVFVDAIIRVVAQPPAPTPTDQVVCNNISGNLPPFTINFAGASSRIFWFRDNNGVPGPSISNPNGNNSKTFPTSAYHGGAINKSTPGVYRVWARYRRVTNASQNLSCETVLVPVTLTIKQAIPTPVFTAGDSEVCNGETGIGYSLQIPASSLNVNNPGNPQVVFNTEYFWSASVAGVTFTSTNPGQNATAQNATVNFNIPDAAFGGANSMTVNIRAVRRYTTNSTFPGASACESDVAEFPVLVHRNTAAGTLTGGDTQCAGSELADITWNPGVGSILTWEYSPSGTDIPEFGTATTVDPTVLGLTGAPTVYNFRAVIRNGTCATLTTPTVSYTINPNAVPADAGPDQTGLCFAGVPPLNAVLAGNMDASFVTTSWSVVSSPAGAVVNFTPAATNPAATASVDRPGTYVFRWTVNNGTCTSQDDVTVIYGRDPSIPAPTASSFCSLDGQLTAVANTFEDVEWTFVSGPAGGTATITDATTIPTDVSVNVYGAYTFNLEFSSGGCAPRNTNVVINFNRPATVDPLTDQLVCGQNFAVTGNVRDGGAVQNGRWEIVNGTGGFASTGGGSVGTTQPAIPISDTYQPSAGDITQGFVILRLVALDHDGAQACTSVSADVRYDLDRLPGVADVGDDFEVCGTSANLVATAPINGGTASWSNITAGPDIVDPANTASVVNDLQLGANQFLWTVNSAQGRCAATTATLTITRLASPVVNNATFDDLCETDPNTGIKLDEDLNSATYYNAITGGVPGLTITWFRDAAHTIPVATPATEDVEDNGVYFVSVSTNPALPTTPSCSSEGIITFEINASPFVSNLLPSICEDPLTPGAVQNVNLTARNGDVSLGLADRSVTWFEDALLTTPVATPNDQDNVVDGDQYFARVTNTISGCSNIAQVTFDVNLIPTINPIEGPLKVCLDPNTVVFYKVGTLKANHTYQWTIPPSVVNVTGEDQDFFVTLQFPTSTPSTVNLVVVETSPEGCSRTSDPYPVEIEDSPNSLTITGPAEICEGTAGVHFIADDFQNLNYTWTVPAGASIIQGQTTREIVVDFGPGGGASSVTVTPSTSAGCIGSGFTFPFTINLKPELSIPAPIEICSKQASAFTITTSGTEPAASYNLTRVTDAGLVQTGGTVIPSPPVFLTGAGANVLADQAFENKTGGPLNSRYTVQPVSAKNCIGNSGIITLRVNPEPELDPGLGKDLCSEEPTSITLRPAVGKIDATSYIIKSIDNPSGLTTVNPLPTLNTPLTNAAIANDQWIYNGGGIAPDFKTVTYHVAPVSAQGCEGFPAGQLTIQIFPKPIFDNLPYDKTICSGDGQNISITTNNAPGSVITWELDFISPEIVGAGGGIAVVQPAVITDVLTNTTENNAGMVRYGLVAENQISASKSCFSDPLQVEVTVNPAPNAVAASLELCSDAPTNGLVATTDLNQLNDDVSSTAGSGLTTFTWFTAYPGSPVPNALSHPVNNGTTLFVEVRHNTSLCTRVAPVAITVNDAVDLELTAKNLDCFEDKSGEVVASPRIGGPAGTLTGTGPYTFQLNAEPAVSSNEAYNFTGRDANVLFTITITDANMCSATESVTLTQPTLPLALDHPPLITNVSCNFDVGNLDSNGEIQVNATGGTLPPAGYTFTLLPGSITNTTGLFDNLRPGVYSVSVEDQNGCTDEAFPVEVTAPPPLEITSVQVAEDANGNNISCKDATDGQITVTAQGGNSPAAYTYTLTPLVGPDNVGDVAGDDVSPAIFNNVGAGTYGIIVIDSKDCKSPRSLTFIAPVPALDPGLVGVDQSICFDQENADAFVELATVTGGTGAYTYEWQQSATGDVANDAEWFTIPGATGPTFDPDGSSPFAAPGTIHYRRLVRTTSTLPSPPAFCQNPTGKNRKVTVTVHPKPIVTFEPVSSEICEGLPLVIDVALQPGTGTLPLNYDYSDGNVNFSGEIASKIIVPNIQNSATYTLTRAEDANGCLSEDVPIVRNISVIKLNSDFNVVQPGEGCSGSEFSFTWDADPDVQYRWVWGDGTSEVTYNGASDPQISGPQTERHVFVSGSTTSDTFYPVRLIATKGLCPPKPTSKEVKVYPRIILNILPGDTELCSGETLTIRDQSLGVTSGTWYYQENTPGNTDRLEEKAGPINPLTYVLTNNTTANPLSLRVVYEATNGPCSETEDVIVQVYRGVNADFNVDAVPDFIGAESEVQLTNTSVPNDADFSYTFDYGDDEAIETFNDGTSYRVLYNSPGSRDIQLRVVNLAAQAAGETCVSSMVKQINVNRPDLDASFTVTPRAFCLPGTIVADNESPGADTFEWTLSRDGVVIDRTTVTDPSWTISAPGSYSVQLVASYSQSTQAPVIQTVSGIQVFDNPVAQFEIFLTQAVYIGTPVRVNNGTTGATSLSWNFGDHPESENSDLPNPTHVYQTEGKFDITLTAYNDHGPFDQDGDGIADGNVVCSDQTVQEIFVKPGGTLKVPNAFTPHEGNSEGGGPGTGTTNDYFLPIMDGVEEFTMQIFDRWGTLIFESRDKNQGWSGHDRNGRLMPAGVYVYKIVLRLTDNSRTTKIGDVTLIR